MTKNHPDNNYFYMQKTAGTVTVPDTHCLERKIGNFMIGRRTDFHKILLNNSCRLTGNQPHAGEADFHESSQYLLVAGIVYGQKPLQSQAGGAGITW